MKKFPMPLQGGKLPGGFFGGLGGLVLEGMNPFNFQDFLIPQVLNNYADERLKREQQRANEAEDQSSKVKSSILNVLIPSGLLQYELLIHECPADFAKVVLELAKEFENVDETYTEMLQFIRTLKQQTNVEPIVRSQKEEENEQLKKKKNKGKMRCVLWNMCGMEAQMTFNVGFAALIYFLDFDVVLLNELKIGNPTDPIRLETLVARLGYQFVHLPSSRPNKRAMRGSCILIKTNSKIDFVGSDAQGYLKDGNGTPAFEVVTADVRFLNNPYRFFCCYWAPQSATTKNFSQIAGYIRDHIHSGPLSGNTFIVCGDFNLNKETGRDLFSSLRLQDCLDPAWKTNRQGDINFTTRCGVTEQMDCIEFADGPITQRSLNEDVTDADLKKTLLEYLSNSCCLPKDKFYDRLFKCCVPWRTI